METFDTLYVTCPGCFADIGFQAKLGPCKQKNYRIDNCPPIISGELNESIQKCPRCGGQISIHTHTMINVGYVVPDAETKA